MRLSHKNPITTNIELPGYNIEQNPTESSADGTLIYIKKNFMAPFYGWGSTASRLEPLRGGSLLFTTKFPEVPGTHFIDLVRMKG